MPVSFIEIFTEFNLGLLTAFINTNPCCVYFTAFTNKFSRTYLILCLSEFIRLGKLHSLYSVFNSIYFSSASSLIRSAHSIKIYYNENSSKLNLKLPLSIYVRSRISLKIFNSIILLFKLLLSKFLSLSVF